MTFNRNLISALVLSLMAAGAMAQAKTKADDHKAHHPDQAASSAPAKAKPAEPAASGMHGHMSKHCKDMQKIQAIKDPEKRQKAMDEHMKTMKEGDCDMMKDGMKDGMMGSGMGASAPADMKPGMGK